MAYQKMHLGDKYANIKYKRLDRIWTDIFVMYVGFK